MKRQMVIVIRGEDHKDWHTIACYSTENRGGNFPPSKFADLANAALDAIADVMLDSGAITPEQNKEIAALLEGKSDEEINELIKAMHDTGLRRGLGSDLEKLSEIMGEVRPLLQGGNEAAKDKSN